MATKHVTLVAAFAAMVIASASPEVRAQASEWPDKPIRVVVPLAAGGAADLVMRAVGEQITASLKQPVILENRPGGGGTIAAELVMRAPPDGYTLLMGNSATFGIAPYLVKKLNFDPLKDFVPITTMAELPIVLAVNASLPVNNVAEFIAYTKKNPGKLSFGSSGYGTTMHLSGELLNHQAGIQMVHIPYKGGAPALVDLMSGQVPVVMGALSTLAPHIGKGQIKILATVEGKRASSHPDIPSVGETLKGYAVPPSWLGVLAPAGLPDALADRMNAEFVKATNAPAVRALLEKNGFELVTRTRAEFVAEIKESYTRFGRIAELSKVEPR